ncbi:hypothetical protein WMZ97_16645 [Lentibacillus sp. N15]|uniref:hypothetical protein n=1 Tax=Lentibacillus songyuanensis TaxID=3136161 RepID=UPI0031BB8D00
MKKLMKSVMELFSVAKIVLFMFLILAGSVVYLYLVTQNITMSVVLGFFAMLFGFHHSVYLPEKLKREQHLLKELQKYTTSMVFYLQSGYNVLQSLNFAKRNLDEAIKKDIEKTMIGLQEKAVLDTTYFDKYRFTSLNIFHQILKIKYDKGGAAKELFTKANESINFEIVKRDELYRRKKFMKMKVFMMMGMAAAIPLVFVFFAKELYTQFLTMGFIAVGINAILFILLQISLFFLQRTATDVSINV